MSRTTATTSIRASEVLAAIARQELYLEYQAVTEATSGTPAGFEALVRWHHPRLGDLPPMAFVPLTEGRRLAVALTSWVVGEAATQWRRWLDSGFNTRISVNLSPRALTEPGAARDLAALVEAHGCPPACVTLELTERFDRVTPGELALGLAEAAAAGFRLALDDVGAGESSLVRLGLGVFDEIKIDGLFSAGVASRHTDRCIVEALVDLGHRLGLAVVAEGVESEVSRVWLVEHSADLLQGFEIHRPAAGAEVLARWGPAPLTAISA